MAEPADELEQILGEAHVRLSKIRLELPILEGDGPAPPSPAEWAAASLAPPSPSRPVRAAPAPSVSTVFPRVEIQRVVSSPQVPADPQPLPSVELPAEPLKAEAPEPPLPAPVPVAAPSAPEILPPRTNDFDVSLSLRTSKPTRALLLTAAFMAAAGGIWWSLSAPSARQELPLASFDALSAHVPGQWLIARHRELLHYDTAQKLAVLARLPKPLNSMLWTDGTLYATDGINTLLRWERLDGAPQTFALDHAPVAIFARAPHIWTLDEEGNLRQFLFSHSMTGVFLQPLDLSKAGLSGDFSLGDNGSLIILERSSGNILRLTRDKSAYTVTTRGPSYGAGARLLPSSRGLWIARADGEKTTLILVPAPR